MAKFQKGGKRPPNAGRKRGSINKTTRVLKDAILLAGQLVGDPRKRGRGGLVGYLCFLADEYPPAFVSLLLRALPLEEPVDAQTGQTERPYPTFAEVERDLASRGLMEILQSLTKVNQVKKDGGDADAHDRVDDDNA